MTPDAFAREREAGLKHSILAFLPRPLLEARRPLIAVATAWATAFVPSILLSALVMALMPDAVQPEFDVKGVYALLTLAVVAPILETLIMGAVLSVLLLFAGPAMAVMVSAIGWGVAHSLVAPAWGLVIWWPFLVFSALFVTWRERSLFAALAIAATVHGLHNLPSALLLVSGLA